MAAKRLISFLLAFCLIASFVGTLPKAYTAETVVDSDNVGINGKSSEKGEPVNFYVIITRRTPIRKDPTAPSAYDPYLKTGDRLKASYQKKIGGKLYYWCTMGSLAEGYVPADCVRLEGSSGSKNPNTGNSTSKNKGTPVDFYVIITRRTPIRKDPTAPSSNAPYLKPKDRLKASYQKKIGGKLYYWCTMGSLAEGYVPADCVRLEGTSGSKKPNNDNSTSKDKGDQVNFYVIITQRTPIRKDPTSPSANDPYLKPKDRLKASYQKKIGGKLYYWCTMGSLAEGYVPADCVQLENSSNSAHSNPSNSSTIPSTAGRASYLAANSAYNNVRTPSGDIVKGIQAGTLFRCYGECEYDSGRVWIDLNDDNIIDGSILRGSSSYSVSSKLILFSSIFFSILILKYTTYYYYNKNTSVFQCNFLFFHNKCTILLNSAFNILFNYPFSTTSQPTY